jgi:hypothetical protein
VSFCFPLHFLHFGFYMHVFFLLSMVKDVFFSCRIWFPVDRYCLLFFPLFFFWAGVGYISKSVSVEFVRFSQR